MAILRELIDPKVIRIISVLLEHKLEHYHIQKLSRAAKVPLGSTFRILHKLVSLGIVDCVKIDKFKIYCLTMK